MRFFKMKALNLFSITKQQIHAGRHFHFSAQAASSWLEVLI